ncbi:MAG: GNAT family N-acetyltransferase [Promethearchaeota archaeon]|nr:MAG: GNAT family N-acetyltransferase [Candidatus Lokiarchaeota archaeon]
MNIQSLRSVTVNQSNENIFYDFIKDNFTEYFFFHVDYAQYPKNTEVYMALDKKDKIQGIMLIWKGQRIQLRGSIKSLDLLLKDKSYAPLSITGFANHKKIIAKYFPEHTKEIPLYRMAMERGDHVDFEKFPYENLSMAHKEEIASFMNVTDPVFWGDRRPEDILIDDNNFCFGIFQDGKLISITLFWKYQDVGYIIVVGTHPDYQNKGYASSLVSSALKHLFQNKKQCLITVRVNNPPAIHTYQKLGFTIRNAQYQYNKENE